MVKSKTYYDIHIYLRICRIIHNRLVQRKFGVWETIEAEAMIPYCYRDLYKIQNRLNRCAYLDIC